MTDTQPRIKPEDTQSRIEMVECPSCRAHRMRCFLCGGTGTVTEGQFEAFHENQKGG